MFLLIEPIWNRNQLEKDTAEAIRDLLIEPIWNRNLYIDCINI